MNQTINYLLAIIGLLLATPLFGESNYDERASNVTSNLTKYNGLAGESVARIITDRQGLIWLATSNGVNVFNGKQLINVPIKSAQQTANYIFDICEDADHTLYIATKQGVFELKQDGNAFTPTCRKIGKCETVLADHGTIYAGNREGLHIAKDDRYRTITVGATPMGLENSVRDIRKMHDGNILFVTRYAVNIYIPKTGKTTSWRVADHMPEGAALSRVAMVGNVVFVGTKNDGLYRCDLHKRTVEVIPEVGNVVTHILTTRRGEVCVSCDGAGAFLLNTQGKIMQQFNTDSPLTQLPTNSVYCYYRDANGIDWFGMFRHGLLYKLHTSPLFHIYGHGDFSSEGLDVSSYFYSGKECLMGTSNGLFYIDEKRGKKIQVPAQELGGRIVKAIEAYNGKFYLGLYDGGLCIFDPHTGTITRSNQDKLLNNTSITALKAAPDNRLWIGTSEGLYILDKKGKLLRYTENNARLTGSSISAICFSHNRLAWLGGPNGLTLYSVVTKQFESTNFPSNFFNKEPIREINMGHDHLLFFNTGERIFYADPAMKTYDQLKLPKEAVKEKYYSILDDRQGYYWLNTESGLFRVDYGMANLQHFGAGEGLRCDFINGNLHIDNHDRLWMGTSNGLMWVDLRQMHQWQQLRDYRTMIYDVLKGGERCPLSEAKSINRDSKIHISWNMGSEHMAFKVLLNDFALPMGRLFQYKIDKEEWLMATDGQELSLTGLMPGSHQLTIRLAGAAGTEHTYRIMVLPSWLAIIELLLVIVSITLFILWRRYHQNTNAMLQERNEIEEALIEVVDQQQKSEENATVPIAEDTQKYQRVKLNEEECQEIVKQMDHILENDKVYMNPELKMSDIAEQLHLSPSKLSQIFNLYIKANYYEYINHYRLTEFKRLIDQGEYKRYTLTALSEKCGFKKSSFFSTFRKVEGMTPTEYLKKQGIKL